MTCDLAKELDTLLKQTGKLLKELMATVQDPKAPETDRVSAASQAVDFGKKDSELAKKLIRDLKKIIPTEIQLHTLTVNKLK